MKANRNTTAVMPAPTVRMVHQSNGHAPTDSRPPISDTCQWEYLSVPGGQQSLLNIHGLQGWEAFGIAQVPGQMTIWMKRRKIA